MQSVKRPLSPHLGHYKLPMPVLLSITHRATGVALCAGALILVYWLMALAGGPEVYAQAHGLLTSGFGYVVLIAFSWAMYYHLCNGDSAPFLGHRKEPLYRRSGGFGEGHRAHLRPAHRIYLDHRACDEWGGA